MCDDFTTSYNFVQWPSLPGMYMTSLNYIGSPWSTMTLGDYCTLPFLYLHHNLLCMSYVLLVTPSYPYSSYTICTVMSSYSKIDVLLLRHLEQEFQDRTETRVNWNGTFGWKKNAIALLEIFVQETHISSFNQTSDKLAIHPISL